MIAFLLIAYAAGAGILVLAFCRAASRYDRTLGE